MMGSMVIKICADETDLSTDEEKEALKQQNEDAKAMFETMKTAIGDGVSEVRFTDKLKNHPVCLTSEGGVSLEMEKVLGQMPGHSAVKAKVALEINKDHPIAEKLKTADSLPPGVREVILDGRLSPKEKLDRLGRLSGPDLLHFACQRLRQLDEGTFPARKMNRISAVFPQFVLGAVYCEALRRTSKKMDG